MPTILRGIRTFGFNSFSIRFLCRELSKLFCTKKYFVVLATESRKFRKFPCNKNGFFTEKLNLQKSYLFIALIFTKDVLHEFFYIIVPAARMMQYTRVCFLLAPDYGDRQGMLPAFCML